MALRKITDERVLNVLADLIDTDPDHYHLKNAGVSVDAFEKTGAQLKFQGYPAEATIKKTSQADREQGKADAILTFDSTCLTHYLRKMEKGGSDKELRALIDHELYHLEVVIDDWEYELKEDGTHQRDEAGNSIKKRAHYKYDESARPKLAIRLHDVQMGWFSRMVEKHGKASGEARQVKFLTDHFGNLLFNFAATEDEIRETRDRFAFRMDKVPHEFHADYEEELAKRDRKMVRSQKECEPADVE